MNAPSRLKSVSRETSTSRVTRGSPHRWTAMPPMTQIRQSRSSQNSSRSTAAARSGVTYPSGRGADPEDQSTRTTFVDGLAAASSIPSPEAPWSPATPQCRRAWPVPASESPRASGPSRPSSSHRPSAARASPAYVTTAACGRGRAGTLAAVGRGRACGATARLAACGPGSRPDHVREGAPAARRRAPPAGRPAAVGTD